MRKKNAIALAVAATCSIPAFARAGAVIGNWEGQSDGWIDWTQGLDVEDAGPYPNYSSYNFTSEGATLGNEALQWVLPDPADQMYPGYTQGPADKLEYNQDSNGNSEMQDFLDSYQFSIDVSYNAADWSGPGTYSVMHLVINSPGTGFKDIGQPTTDTGNNGYPGGWDTTHYPGMTTRQMTWNYSSYLSEIGANPQYVELILVSEVDSNFTSGAYYLDDAVLGVPSVTGTWGNSAGGSWATMGNWNGGLPNNAGDTAIFGTVITGPSTVTLDGNHTVGNMNFNTGASYTIAQGTGGTLTLNSGGGGNAVINDQFGNHTISAPMVLSSNLTVAVGQSSNTFTMSGNISGTGGITLNGTTLALAAGTVELSGSNSYNGATTVTGGTLLVAGHSSLPNNNVLAINPSTQAGSAEVQLAPGSGGQTLSSLTINTNGTMDITNNHLIINYGSNPSPKSTILGYLTTGSNTGAWNGTGIISSTAANLAGQNYGVSFSDGADGINPALTSGEIEVAYSQYGDITQQGLVNATDFHILASNFGQVTTNGWEAGDFLYQGVVNANDFHLLAENFGQTASGENVSMPASDWAAIDAFEAANGLSITSVPEPATVGLIGVAAAGLLVRRRAKKA